MSIPTVANVMREYLADAALRGARAMPTLNRQALRVIEFMGDELASEARPYRFYQLQRTLRTRGYSPSTVNGTLGCVRAAFRFAAKTGLLEHRVEFPSALPEHNARRGLLSIEAYHSIRRELPEWARDPFSFAYNTGWRRSEVCTLSWDEVDLGGKVVRLDPRRSKNREGRTIPFLGELPAVFARRMRARIVGLRWVFHIEARKICPESLDRVFRGAAIRAGHPKAYLHDCRRTAYRELLRRGVREKVARDMVGWKGTRMPERYGIVNELDLAEAAELFDRRGGRKEGP